MEFLDRYFLDNTIRSYLIVVAMISVVFLFKKLISNYLIVFLSFLIQKFTRLRKEIFKEKVLEPLSWVIALSVSIVALDKLVFPDYWKFKVFGVSTQSMLQGLGRVIVIISVIRFVLKVVDYIAEVLKMKTKRYDSNDIQVIYFIRDFLKIVLGIIGVIWLLHSGFNRDVSKVLTGLSIVGAAVALAAKESLENLIASFIIFFDKPFHVGDLLKVNNVTGTVEKVGLRSTRIRTNEKTLVTIPNKQMVDSVVDNYTKRTHRKGALVLELNSKSSNKTIESFVEYCNQLFYAEKETVSSFSVHVSDLTKSAITISIEFFTQGYSADELNEFKEKMILKIREKMESLKLTFSSTSEIRIINEDQGPVPPEQKSII